MMTKQQYVNLMQRFAALDSAVSELDDVAYRLFDSGFGAFFSEFEALICDAIEAGMEDGESWTCYFAFERDFNLGEDCVEAEDGSVIPTHTWEQVYDLIMDTNAKLGGCTE